MRALLVGVVSAFILGGCAAQTKYYWGTYEPALYQYYKTPSQLADYSAELARTIDAAAAKGLKVPPGVYAEYGYALQQQGKLDEAATFYEKEKKAWPESTQFMDVMVKSLEAARKNGSRIQGAKS